MMLHEKNIKVAGVGISKADRVLIMLHGRGDTADNFIPMAKYFNLASTHVIAPQATNNSWYPFSFLAPQKQNQPWLKSSLDWLLEIVTDIQYAGIKSHKIYIMGFSQGACLALEFVAQNVMQYGGIIAFTGGLIGESLNIENYSGDFSNTKIFIGNSDTDPHVPLVRSKESKNILEEFGADVTLKVYPGMAHTINEDEIDWVNQNIFL